MEIMIQSFWLNVKRRCENVFDAIDSMPKQGGSFVVEGGIAEGDGYESGCY